MFISTSLIFNKFKDFLDQKGVKEIKALNEEFNMDLHEAVTKIPVTDKKKKGKVLDIIEKGYLLHEKVIRYPKVVIGEQTIININFYYYVTYYNILYFKTKFKYC